MPHSRTPPVDYSFEPAARIKADESHLPTVALPLGALLLAGSMGAWAQEAPTPSSADKTLASVTVKESVEGTQGKTTLRATTTSIGKGTQPLRDIPQSVTVLTEKLMEERNLDDLREVLRNTAGITFLAGETGEEDIRLRGFSLGQAGDIYSDGMRDAPLIEHDTFNHDRVEVLKGSASMLFGKGSTGGVVNQVSKTPFLNTQHEASLTIGSGNERRFTGDFNLQTAEDAALRLNVMVHDATKGGAEVHKKGLAPAYSWGLNTPDEFSVGLYHLESDGRPNYNHPWFLSNGTNGQINPTLPAGNYYGLASDYLSSSADYVTLSHKHRFEQDSTLQTRVRHGRYERDLWASVLRFGTTNGATTTASNLGSDTLITRTPKGRVAMSDITQIQSDYEGRFDWLGKRHHLLAGVDFLQEKAQRANNFAGTASGLTTTVGTPNDGDSAADTRGSPLFNTFQAQNIGLYAQDTVPLNTYLKLIGGLRYDRFNASYQTQSATASNGTVTPAYEFDRTEGLWSPRIGALFQPDAETSYYASLGTSYNTSGDAYQFTPNGPNSKDAQTGPEKSRNIEIGGKFELFEQRASLGVALFRSEKYNERNTDPDSAATQNLLSGKRHATGMEFNLAGRISPQWEVFYNHTWIPSARIDKSNVVLSGTGTGAQVQGDRPALTPKHSASLWSTYRLTSSWRVGAGLNYRGEQNPEGARHVIARAFTTVDAMAEYQMTEQSTVKLNITNLTDKLYADSLYRGFYAPGAERTVQVTFKTLF